MQIKIFTWAYWLLPSLFYLIEAAGLLGNTGSGFNLDLGRLGMAWPFALVAAPIYLLSGYPPAWAWLASAVELTRSTTRRSLRLAHAVGSLLALMALILVSIFWFMRTIGEPYAWTRILLALITWLLVYFLGKSSFKGKTSGAIKRVKKEHRDDRNAWSTTKQ
ncbi:MAG: hypothetical protein RL036_566 [Actinomycetota bacterium]|jgi:hypothetical protein